MTLKKIFIIVILTFLNKSYGQNAEMATINTKIESTLNEFNRKYNINSMTPGYAIGLVTHDTILQYFEGLSDLTSKHRIHSLTKFRMASVSKQFTGAIILTLIEEKKLAINDNVITFLPNLNKIYSDVTIEDLIHHVSGIKDYVELFALMGYPENQLPVPEKVFEIINAQSSLNFIPKTQYSYSNSNYFLLARIIEKILGEPLHSIANKRLFNPLKMNNTSFLHEDYDFDSVARGYYFYNARYHSFNSNDYVTGDGGLVSNLNDMCIWAKNYLTGSFPIENFLAKMTRVEKTLDSLTDSYGYGFYKETINDHSIYKHGGIFCGYTHDIAVVSEKNFALVILTNSNPKYNVEELTYNIISSLTNWNLSKTASKEKNMAKQNIISSGNFSVNQKMNGNWHSNEIKTKCKIEIESNTLVNVYFENNKYEFTPINKNTIILNDMQFIYDENKKLMLLNTTKTKNVIFKKEIK
ncbi:serine hydrolase [uncultured Psychroserpens sp.]|uniref:serine hydrolase domain-containing protein n=1 Tax=uncultured Psychroserpens sp. TaxID=255436 RepID=UPI00262B7F3E|nr:serine hydrolase domain-containing protein [uncultured Psychroserpens sp.]